jgi:hypothetical protein
MLLCGVLLLAAGGAFAFSRGQLRSAIISFVDTALLRRPGPRWSFMFWAVLLGAFFVGVALFFVL